MKIFETTFDFFCIDITDYASWTIKIVLMMHNTPTKHSYAQHLVEY